MRRAKTEAIVQRRVDRLCRRFKTYLEVFEKKDRFTGPSLYFHRRAMAQRRGKDCSQLLADPVFLEYVYAVLASWGMHRMGSTGAKLLPFEELARSIRSQRSSLEQMWAWPIHSVTEEQIDHLWSLIHSIHASATRTILVANSKVLHHLLPRLVPPIDREYTLWFFNYWDIGGLDEPIFRNIYPKLQEISNRCRKVIAENIGTHPWHTSSTKVLDSALVGFVLKELS